MLNSLNDAISALRLYTHPVNVAMTEAMMKPDDQERLELHCTADHDTSKMLSFYSKVTFPKWEGLKTDNFYENAPRLSMIVIILCPTDFDVYFCSATSANVKSMLQTTETLFNKWMREQKLSQTAYATAVAEVNREIAQIDRLD